MFLEKLQGKKFTLAAGFVPLCSTLQKSRKHSADVLSMALTHNKEDLPHCVAIQVLNSGAIFMFLKLQRYFPPQLN